MSNEKAQQKIITIRVPRLQEKAISGVFAVTKIQNELPNVFSQQGKSSPHYPVGRGQGNDTPTFRFLQISLYLKKPFAVTDGFYRFVDTVVVKKLLKPVTVLT